MAKTKGCPASVITSIRRDLNWTMQTAQTLPVSDVVYDLQKIDRRLAECSISGVGGLAGRHGKSRRGGLGAISPSRLADDMLVNYGTAGARSAVRQRLRKARGKKSRAFWGKVAARIRKG